MSVKYTTTNPELSRSPCCQISQIFSHHLAKNKWMYSIQASLAYIWSSHCQSIILSRDLISVQFSADIDAHLSSLSLHLLHPYQSSNCSFDVQQLTFRIDFLDHARSLIHKSHSLLQSHHLVHAGSLLSSSSSSPSIISSFSLQTWNHLFHKCFQDHWNSKKQESIDAVFLPGRKQWYFMCWFYDLDLRQSKSPRIKDHIANQESQEISYLTSHESNIASLSDFKITTLQLQQTSLWHIFGDQKIGTL